VRDGYEFSWHGNDEGDEVCGRGWGRHRHSWLPNAGPIRFSVTRVLAAPFIKDARTFPRSPLAQQRRIVAKVDELIAPCDRWRQASPPPTAARQRNALLAEARAPTDHHELEAAE
jgi:hypothetical protein